MLGQRVPLDVRPIGPYTPAAEAFIPAIGLHA